MICPKHNQNNLRTDVYCNFPSSREQWGLWSGHDSGYLPFSFHWWRCELSRFIPVSEKYGALWYYTYPFRFTRVITNVYRSRYVCMHGFQFSTVFCRSACNGHKTHARNSNKLYNIDRVKYPVLIQSESAFNKVYC